MSKKSNFDGKVLRFSLLIESSDWNLSCFLDIVKPRKKQYLPNQKIAWSEPVYSSSQLSQLLTINQKNPRKKFQLTRKTMLKSKNSMGSGNRCDIFGVEMSLNLSLDFASLLHFHQWQKVSWYVFELSNTPHKFDMVVPCKMLTNPQSFLQFVRQHVLTSLGHTKKPNYIHWHLK